MICCDCKKRIWLWQMTGPDYQSHVDCHRQRMVRLRKWQAEQNAKCDIFVHGIPAERCAALSGTDYALVPKSPDSTVTINGVPLEFIPPTTDPDEKMVIAVKRSVIDAANQRMDGWKFVEVRRVDDVPVYELRWDSEPE